MASRRVAIGSAMKPIKKRLSKQRHSPKPLDTNASRGHISVLADDISRALRAHTPTNGDAIAWYYSKSENATTLEGSSGAGGSLFHQASHIPRNLELDDFVQLITRDSPRLQYVPPWWRVEQADHICDTTGLVLEPTVTTKLPEKIPGSCPCSPERVWLHEVPDSEPEFP